MFCADENESVEEFDSDIVCSEGYGRGRARRPTYNFASVALMAPAYLIESLDLHNLLYLLNLLI